MWGVAEFGLSLRNHSPSVLHIFIVLYTFPRKPLKTLSRRYVHEFQALPSKARSLFCVAGRRCSRDVRHVGIPGQCLLRWEPGSHCQAGSVACRFRRIGTASPGCMAWTCSRLPSPVGGSADWLPFVEGSDRTTLPCGPRSILRGWLASELHTGDGNG